MTFDVKLPETIFVDESGNAGLNDSHNQKRPFFIIGFVFSKSPFRMKKKLDKLLRKMQNKKKWHPHLNELKFFPFETLKKMGIPESNIRSDWAPYFDGVRNEISKIIVNNSDGIFAGVVDKRKKIKDSWKPDELGNYLFRRSLINYILPQIDVTKFDILYDRGRLSSLASKSFNNYLHDSESYFDYRGWKEYSGTINKVIDVDSLENSGLWTADHVAGAFHVLHKYNIKTWAELLKPKFIGRGHFDLW